ncbi:MAG: calcium/sodium antiporter [Chloroflexi bacterium]|nr:calcium/sodium antiporter [Chloroflexota bacterium]
MQLLDFILVGVGIVGLFLGGNYLVVGASRLAASFGLSTLVIGLTVVAFGTSAPELLVSLASAVEGVSDIAIGNVIGSNIANIGLILALAAIIFPIQVKVQIVRREIPAMIGTVALLFLLILDNEIGRVDGLILLVALAAFNYIVFLDARRSMREHNEEEARNGDAPTAEEEATVARTRLFNLGRVILGAVLLLVGAQFTVTGAVAVARDLGVSELLIGISLVAVGTSLPELAAAMAAATRRSSDIVVGNVVGSNIFNILLILGLTAVIQPISVDLNAVQFQFAVMAVFSLLVLPFVLDRVLGRREGAFLFALYVVFIIYLFVQSSPTG